MASNTCKVRPWFSEVDSTKLMEFMIKKWGTVLKVLTPVSLNPKFFSFFRPVKSWWIQLGRTGESWTSEVAGTIGIAEQLSTQELPCRRSLVLFCFLFGYDSELEERTGKHRFGEWQSVSLFCWRTQIIHSFYWPLLRLPGFRSPWILYLAVRPASKAVHNSELWLASPHNCGYPTVHDGWVFLFPSQLFILIKIQVLLVSASTYKSWPVIA